MSLLFAVFALVNSVFCVCLGLFTLSRNPRHPANIGFLLGMIGLSVIEAGNALTMYFFSPALPPFGTGIRLSAAGQALLPLLWFPFSLSFARAGYADALKRWKYPFAIVLSAVLVIVYSIFTNDYILAYSGSSYSETGDLLFSTAKVLLPPVSNYLYLLVIAGLVFNLVQLENTFRNSETSQRWQIKYTVFGVSAIFVFFIYLASRGILFLNVSFQMFPALSTVIFVSTGMMSVFIVRHRL
ncbi:MAG: hypothetical protein ACE5FU_06855, partial [Nitrospinota bacterium]